MSVNSKHRGSTLLLALVFLLLATVIVLFMVPTGLFEQRTSGNDLRAKFAQSAAETGLAHGKEFVRLKRATLSPAPGAAVGGVWTACTDNTFPCGAAPDLTRGLYYKYTPSSGVAVDFPAFGATSSNKLVSKAGNFDATYDVGLLLCRIAVKKVAGVDVPECTTDATRTSGPNVFVVVSRGSLTGESATATVSESIGTYRLINLPPSVPPVMVAGTVTGLGSSTIVGNPNSGGFGVPLSIWARNNIDGSGGSWQTCQQDEYFRSGNPLYVGEKNDVAICRNCNCGTTMSSPGNEGFDLLDSLDSDGGKLIAGTDYYFPCDLFEYVFGFSARADDDVNGHCEALKDIDPVNSIPDVEEFLQANAQIKTCAEVNTLGTSASGLIWVRQSCGAGNALSGTIGSPDEPVVLVIDGSLKPDTNLELYGLVFLRTRLQDSAPCLSGGSGCPEWLTGGGSSVVFGAVVIEGGGTINGTVDIVYVPQIMANIVSNPKNFQFGNIPGSWTDRLRY